MRTTASGLTAVLPPGTRGTAVVAAPAIAGWTCQGREPESYAGLLAVPVTGPAVSCSFRPPGLTAGLAAGAAALLCLASRPWWGRPRRRS
ncbi:hypothetical protein AB0E83_09640 [Streptomyces sp. NPDC035033]|uniref:hypothetical protein n=1 Tax=Streptomyces sp. NPDC035033 TaxID=3155368 RepID=UPI0033F950D1